jgi:hypothetical protein
MTPGSGPAGGAYDAAQRRVLATALASGRELLCPACGSDVTATPVDPPAGVAYVRRRVLVICPRCRRSAGLDAKS